jgi:hypothetical protein
MVYDSRVPVPVHCSRGTSPPVHFHSFQTDWWLSSSIRRAVVVVPGGTTGRWWQVRTACSRLVLVLVLLVLPVLVSQFQRQGDHCADGGTKVLARTLPADARSTVILCVPRALPGRRRRTGKGAPHQIIDRSCGERGGRAARRATWSSCLSCLVTGRSGTTTTGYCDCVGVYLLQCEAA